MSLTLADLLSIVSDAGTIGLLVVIVFGAFMEWWVSGKRYRKLERQCERQQQLIYHLAGVNERALMLSAQREPVTED